jgi:hypothetical protein
MRAMAAAVLFAAMSASVLAQGQSGPDRPMRGADGWVISETTSPLDYTPIVTATATSRARGEGALAQISVLCRSGRTEFVVTGAPLTAGETEFDLSYRVDAGEPVRLRGGRTNFGTGIAFRGDAVDLLKSLPAAGELSVRVVTRGGTAHEGVFPLAGLAKARERVAAACQWPR